MSMPREIYVVLARSPTYMDDVHDDDAIQAAMDNTPSILGIFDNLHVAEKLYHSPNIVLDQSMIEILVVPFNDSSAFFNATLASRYTEDKSEEESCYSSYDEESQNEESFDNDSDEEESNEESHHDESNDDEESHNEEKSNGEESKE